MSDLISKNWLLNEYDKRHKGEAGGARRIIEEAPTVDAAPVVRCGEGNDREEGGMWTERIDEDEEGMFRRKFVCSCCGDWNIYGMTKFCPECGAKMENPE